MEARLDMTTGGELRPDARRRARLTELARRSKEVLLLSALVGATTGFAVAGFDTVVVRALARIDRAPLAVGLLGPFVGLTIAAIALRFIGPRATPSTADEYLHAFHDAKWRLDGRSLV